MKCNLIASLFLFVFIITSFSRADSTFVLDTIEMRQHDVMTNYYYKNKELKSQDNFYSVFVQSSNPNVMKNYLKSKQLNGSVALISFGGILLSTYFMFCLKPDVDKKDLWLLPAGSACCISVSIPLLIIQHNYFKKAIKEFNIRTP